MSVIEEETRPVFANPDDGVEYYGMRLANIGLQLPFAVFEPWKPTQPVEWLIRGILLSIFSFSWLFTIGWVLLSFGLIMILVGESWNEMREREV